MDVQPASVEEWDQISQIITQLNQVRAFAEADTVAALDQALRAVENCKREIASRAEGSISGTLQGLATECSEIDIISRKRDEGVHSAVNRLKQSISCVVGPDKECEGIGITSFSAEERTQIDRALWWHFLHEGFLETARSFSSETGLMCLPDAEIIRARTGFEAVEAMTARKDLSLAIAWVEEHSSQTSPSLLFDLHKLRFLQLAGSQSEAIGYAQRHLAPFKASRGQEVDSLLGSLILQNQAHQISRSNRNVDAEWQAAQLALSNEIKRPYGSISVLLRSGLIALPELQTYQRLVAKDARITPEMWISQEELPLHIVSSTHFHSEFCCPVSREQTDESNPAMMLSCGHVIAKASITRIAKHRQRFKCPTCPTEQSVDAPVPVHF